MKHLSESYAENILASNFHDTEERETNYHLHHALQHIVAQLAAYEAAADQLMSPEGEQEDE